MSSSKKPNSSPSIRHLVSSSCISCLVFKPPSFAEPLPICVRGCTLHSPQDAQHCLNLRCIPGPNRGRQQPWGDSCGRHTINSQQPLMYVVYTSLSTYVYTYNYLYMYHRIWQVVSEDVRQLLSEHQHLQKKKEPRWTASHISNHPAQLAWAAAHHWSAEASKRAKIFKAEFTKDGLCGLKPKNLTNKIQVLSNGMKLAFKQILGRVKRLLT